MVGIGAACEDNCAELEWGHVFSQFLLAAIPWSLFVTIGVALTIFAPTWSSNGRKKLRAYDNGLSSRSGNTGFSVLVAHIIQCVAFSMRSSSKSVNGAYHAVEFISSLILYIDVVLQWAYIISRGKSAVLAGAFSPLILDCLVMTGPLGVMIAPSGGKVSWFSFSCLGGLRGMRMLLRVHVIRGVVERGGAWAKAVYQFAVAACFVYTGAMLLLTVELLGTPKDEDENTDGGWGVFGSILFLVSTLSTVGDSSLAPATVLGRFFAVGTVVYNFYIQGPKVVALVGDYLLGRNLGLGSYSGPSHHIVVCGSASAPTLWDFLHELYHLNHYRSGDHFDREAPSVVMLIPSRTTLRHINEFLNRRESLLFRERVTIFHGEPSDPDAKFRARMHRAEEIVVLPNLTTADAAGDDAMNIMRAFALTASVPNVRTKVMLHTLEHRPLDFVHTEGNCTFISINAFKLSMLAKACLVPGVMTFICNLCKTIGDFDASTLSWQNQYEGGLGMEVYEVTLEEVYHGCTFCEVATDILARSVSGDVYLIGLNEWYADEFGRVQNRLRIHPGADYRIDNLDGQCQGIFVASEIGDIIQKDPDEYALAPIQREKKKTLRGSVNAGLVDEEELHSHDPHDPPSPKMQKVSKSRKSGKGKPATPDALTEGATVFEAFEKRRLAQLTLEEKAAKLATKSYQDAMNRIGQKLLASGVEIGAVAQMCAEPEDTTKRAKRQNPELPDAPALEPHSESRFSKAADALTDEPHIRSIGLDPIAQKGSLLWNADEEEYQRITKFHKIQERMEADAKRPPEPPASLIKHGGHLLLCIVSSTSSEQSTEVGYAALGPPMGIAHFIKPLREGSQENHPVLVVLADELPRDWYVVAEDDDIYFVSGSPLNVQDLDRAGFRNARAIAINRCHIGTSQNSKVADARAILATTVIEAQFRDRAPPAVITDLAYDASVEFLPQSHAMMLAMAQIKARPPKRAGGGGTNFIELPSLTGERHTRAQEVAASRSLAAIGFEEDYEVLETPDYAEHPRFMCGMVFVTSAMTALLANVMHNGSLIALVDSLLQAPFLLLQVPVVWQGQSYADLCEWLLKHRNLLALGIYRNSGSAAAVGAGGELEDGTKKASLYYMFSAPPAYTTVLDRNDRILVITPKH